MARHNEIGVLGEDVATKWLFDRHFLILNRNYRKKWGEIDIIAEKEGKIHFVEVKSVSYETIQSLEDAVTHETWRPEEKVDERKSKKLKNTITSWLCEHPTVVVWQVDIITVRIVSREKYACVEVIDNVIFE